MATETARKFFCENRSCLFRWEDHGRELVWGNRLTIAFHEELTVALNYLSDGCMPSFMSLALAMSVMRRSWPEVADGITRTLRAITNSKIAVFVQTDEQYKEDIDSWPETLEKLNVLHEYVKTKPSQPIDRAEILVALFGRLESPWSAAEQQEIAEAFRAGLPQEWFHPAIGGIRTIALPTSDAGEEYLSDNPPLFNSFSRDLIQLLRKARTLSTGLKLLATEDVEYQLRTGLDTEIEPAPVSLLDQSLQTRALLNTLKDDPEFSGLARLTQHLMAAISLPGMMTQSSDLPLGGISDITNRGSLDRLLLSELAYDDLTLATRIALNEALFFRREVPPAPQAKSRPILLDNSLPLWGIPRLYGTAVALAVQALTPASVTVDCFRPRGSELLNFKLNDRQNLVDHLSHLEAAATPARCIKAFAELLKKNSDASEPVLITTPDVLKDSQFLTMLDTEFPDALWIVAAERDGRIAVLHRTRQGTSVQKRLHLPLEDILSGRTTAAIRDSEIPHSVPAILKLADFPLRLAHHVRSGRVWKWGEHAISISDDGRIMLWTDKRHGAIQLAADAHFGSNSQLFLVRRNRQLVRFLVQNEAKSAFLVTIFSGSWEVTLVAADPRLEEITDIRLHENTVLVFGSRHRKRTDLCCAIDEFSGMYLGEREMLPDDRTRRGRVYRHDGKWRVLCWTNGVNEWTQQILPKELQSAKIVVEAEPGEFLIVNDKDQLVLPAGPGGTETVFDHLQRRPVLEISSNDSFLPGSRNLVVRCGAERAPMSLNLDTKQREFPRGPLSIGINAVEQASCESIVMIRTPHYRFSMVGVRKDSAIVLRDNRGARFEIVLLADQSQIVLIDAARLPPVSPEVQFTSFEPEPKTAGCNFEMQKATLPDGTCIWLESRGLMHIKSSNVQLKEVTLVMRDGQLSGWLSSGTVFGEDYHVESPDDSRFKRVFEHRVSPHVAWIRVILPCISEACRVPSDVSVNHDKVM
ncbi:MAG: hypothetical protein JNL58_25885 [Planctomyces sp.]|nr:hypothetical protein [Planctomyces sp.]